MNGKLTVMSEGQPEQVYELSKSAVTIGRAMTNDIILSDGRVSRSHARLEFSADGVTALDLGSANGSSLNGVRFERAKVLPGDTLIIGNTQMRFDSDVLVEEHGLTVIDNEVELHAAIDQEVLPFSVNETGQPRLVVFTPQQTFEISLDDLDIATIGRTDESVIMIESSKVSRHHAEVIRKGGIFVLKDLGSTNKTWYKGETVDQVILQDGDVFRIGDAQIVFKSGFQEASLTMADEKLAKADDRRLVIFVPGTMGSDLWIGSQRIWPDVKTMLKNPEILKFPGDPRIEARAIVDQVVIVPNLIKLDQYNRLGDYFVEELHYQRGDNFFEFAYDWRQDVRKSARKLAELVDSLPRERPLVIIGHSLGTLVTRYYVERLGGKQRVERVILLGGPHYGVIKALTSLLVAPTVLPFGIMGERSREVAMTFETAYQILPTYPIQINSRGDKVNFMEDDRWLEEKYRPMLKAAREFRRELGTRSSVPAVSVFGYGLKTIATVNLDRDSDGRVKNVEYGTQPSGDSTVLEISTVLEGSDIHPVQQYHGSLFVDKDVKMRLKVELTRPYQH